MKQEFLYSVEREVAAPIARVWQAWMSAAELEKWYSPTILSVVPGSALSESEVGGRWAIAVDVSANGFNAYFWGRYQELETEKRIVHTMCYSQDELEFALKSDDAPSHRVEIDFDTRGDKTWVRFSQFGELPEGQASAAQEGMESYFDNLEAFLENK